MAQFSVSNYNNDCVAIISDNGAFCVPSVGSKQRAGQPDNFAVFLVKHNRMI